MISTEQRIKLMQYVVANGGKDRVGNSWSELLSMFDIPVNGKTLKQVSDFWRYTKRTGNLAPSSEYETVTITDVDTVNVVDGFDIQIPPGFELSKVWGKPDNPLASFTKIEDENTRDIVEEIRGLISEYSPKVIKRNFKTDERIPIMYEIAIPDFHFGRVPMEEAARLFLNTIVELVGRISAGYRVEKFLLPLGNDFFNSDSIMYTTTAGTPQFDYNEWRELFRMGYRTLLDAIRWLSTIAPVEVKMVPGNHDEQKTFYMGEVFAAYFKDDENVNIDNSLSTFKVEEYGVCGILFDHGQVKEPYPVIFATEYPDIFARTKVRECHNGHIHVEAVKELRGVKVRFIPSIASRSAWEKKKGYNHLREAQAFKWHSEKGLLGTENLQKL